MLNLFSAEKIVLFYINVTHKPKLELVIAKEDTIEFEEGFVFRYDSKRYLEEGDSDYRIAGTYPLIVDKKTGEIYDSIKKLKPSELILAFKKEKGYTTG